MSLSQLHSDDLPIDKLDVVAWPWEHGKPLLPREKIDLLPTRMRMLHDWYLDVSKDPEFVTLAVQITGEHFIGADMMNIFLEELYMLYKLDALDLSIVSCYCL